MPTTPCFSPACSQSATVLLLFGGPDPSIEPGNDSRRQPSELLTPSRKEPARAILWLMNLKIWTRIWPASTAFRNRQSACACSPTAGPAAGKPGPTCSVTISSSAESRPQQNPPPDRKAWKGTAQQ